MNNHYTPNSSNQPPQRGSGFYDSIRQTGWYRPAHSWLGGVCAAFSQRTGIDATLTRIVCAVLILFMPFLLFVYGVAWALLPDQTGQIQLQELFQGRPQAGQFGAAIMIVLGVSSPRPWFFPFGLFGDFFYDAPDTFIRHLVGVFFFIVVPLVVLTAIVVGVVRLVRKNQPPRAPQPPSPGYMPMGNFPGTAMPHAHDAGVPGAPGAQSPSFQHDNNDSAYTAAIPNDEQVNSVPEGGDNATESAKSAPDVGNNATRAQVDGAGASAGTPYGGNNTGYASFTTPEPSGFPFQRAGATPSVGTIPPSRPIIVRPGPGKALSYLVVSVVLLTIAIFVLFGEEMNGAWTSLLSTAVVTLVIAAGALVAAFMGRRTSWMSWVASLIALLLLLPSALLVNLFPTDWNSEQFIENLSENGIDVGDVEITPCESTGTAVGNVYIDTRSWDGRSCQMEIGAVIGEVYLDVYQGQNIIVKTKQVIGETSMSTFGEWNVTSGKHGHRKGKTRDFLPPNGADYGYEVDGTPIKMFSHTHPSGFSFGETASVSYTSPGATAENALTIEIINAMGQININEQRIGKYWTGHVKADGKFCVESWVSENGEIQTTIPSELKGKVDPSCSFERYHADQEESAGGESDSAPASDGNVGPDGDTGEWDSDEWNDEEDYGQETTEGADNSDVGKHGVDGIRSSGTDSAGGGTVSEVASLGVGSVDGGAYAASIQSGKSVQSYVPFSIVFRSLHILGEVMNVGSGVADVDREQ
ncbi:MAG: PspC domain-containing protein [Actinomycetaceae bacterium]|nr:PspC domain-containing protein [Actinomycetaceae bacterium]